MTLDDAMNMIADWLGDQATAQDVADVARWGRENDQLVYQDAFVFAESFDALTVLETLEVSARDSRQTIT